MHHRRSNRGPHSLSPTAGETSAEPATPDPLDPIDHLVKADARPLLRAHLEAIIRAAQAKAVCAERTRCATAVAAAIVQTGWAHERESLRALLETVQGGGK